MMPNPFFPEQDTGGSLTERLEEGLLPLINVVFLLLMFFLIAGIILRDEIPPLPGSQAETSDQRPNIDLVVESDGSLRFHGEAIARTKLATALPDYNPEQRLRLGVERDLSMGELEALFDRLADAGHPEVILLTEPE
ncbi:outer membrane transport energization protein ExbD [Halospina denitrificans]|uniref:Outer membrane transport energization protein ExbD n=1 Tax=Halospina denitrificans TaxID=332522 RepID=A0A4R7K051_9GAMM|nr:biopolymer transporter ExbD [Halospina denitrificans]TDT44181.1 outer membrane transport energization protein ExbD [Halospina denitrificans]